MRHVYSRALLGVCLFAGAFDGGQVFGGQGLSNATPAKEYIYLGNQLIAIEMAAPGSSVRTSSAASNAIKATTATQKQGAGDASAALLVFSKSKLPLQQGYARFLEQAIANAKENAR